MNNKLIAFEYLSLKLIDWYKELKLDEIRPVESDFTKLKLIKLNFFVSAFGATEKNEEDGLLNIFDSFYALPYGHVESDVFNTLSNSMVFSFPDKDRVSLKINSLEDSHFNMLEKEWKNQIDLTVHKIKRENLPFIKYQSFELVELSHKWYSWKSAYDTAIFMGKNSYRIPNNIIKQEVKIFKLNDE